MVFEQQHDKPNPGEGNGEGERDDSRHSAGWMSLFNFTSRRHLPTLFLGMILALAAGLAMPILAIILGRIFNDLTSYTSGEKSSDRLLSDIVHHSIQLLVVGVVNWVLSSVYYSLFTAFGELQAANARGRLFSKLLKRDVEWFQTQQEGIGAFLSGLQAQIHELQVATSQPLAFIFMYSCRGVLCVILAFYTSWNLTLVTVAGIPVFLAIITFLSSKLKPSMEAQQSELTGASKIANNAISSIDTVKCLNGQEFEYRNFSSKIERAAAYYFKQAWVIALQIGAVRFMVFSMIVQSFWYGHTLKHSGKLSSGDVLRTFWGCVVAAQSMEQIMPRFGLLVKGKLAGFALKQVVENRAAGAINTNESCGDLYPHLCEGNIKVCDLSFAYPSQPETTVLKSASLSFPAGETTFVIGKSGSGKSTLGQLLMRFYSPSSGEIFIDGIPIQALDINWVRNNITLVEQGSVLFNESMRTNIAFGRRKYNRVSKEDIQECVDLAMLQSVIDNLPHGIETSVGPGGNFLSGGQKQRVAIARARLRDTPILIMDEPTSSLDFANRTAVLKAIRKWRKGKTTIIITHDVSQIHGDDFVYVLDQGLVIRSGCRDELEDVPGLGKYFFPEDKELDPDNHLYSDNRKVDDTDDPFDHSDDASMSSATTQYDPFFEDEYKVFEDAYTQCTRRAQSSRQRFSNSWELQPSPSCQSIGQETIVDTNSAKLLEPSAAYTVGPSRRSNPYLRHSIVSMYSSPMLNLTELPERKYDSQQQKPGRKRRRPRVQKRKNLEPLSKIMLTIIPSLTFCHRVLLVAGFACAMLHAAATPIFSYCMSQLFGSFFTPGNDTFEAMKWSVIIIGIAILDSFFDGGMHFCLEISGHSWVDAHRNKAMRSVLDQPREWFEKDNNQPLKITSCLDRNAEDMRNIVGKFTGSVVVAVAAAIIAVLWSLASCWELTLVCLPCCPVVYGVTKGFHLITEFWEKRSSDASDAASGIFAETFSEICTVRTLTLEPYFHRKYLGAASKCITVGMKKAAYTGILYGLIESLLLFVTPLTLYYGTVLITKHGKSIEDVVIVESMLLFSIGYVSSVLSWIPQITTSRATATQLMRLTNLPTGVSHEHVGELRVGETAPVKFTQANFRYPSRPDAPVLRDVSITIPKNSCTAIVGRSGSGKSTIASLLLSLYEAPASEKHDQPSISVGGIDIRALHTPSLRSKISIVSQQPRLVPDTIHKNISYGLEENSPLNTTHNVRAAAQAAGIDEFISSLPNDYLTMVGDGGIGLSGGQAQRVVIARALVRQPQILILDEATSALDAQSAGVIRRTVRELVASRRDLTVIIITHAKDMMEIADNVVMMEEGRVIEQGEYWELARRQDGKLKALMEDDG